MMLYYDTYLVNIIFLWRGIPTMHIMDFMDEMNREMQVFYHISLIQFPREALRACWEEIKNLELFFA